MKVYSNKEIEEQEKQEIKELIKSLREIRESFENEPERFEENCKRLLETIYKTLDYEDEGLYYVVYRTDGYITDILKQKYHSNEAALFKMVFERLYDKNLFKESKALVAYKKRFLNWLSTIRIGSYKTPYFLNKIQRHLAHIVVCASFSNLYKNI